MSIVSWTDDPLVSGSKTYSVYITEIQHNCNERQKTASLGVSQWLNASPVEKFKFEHMEQIKKALEDPFLLQYYGYTSIRDILGHPWSAYAENVRTHQKLASYQIINDMRRVVDRMQLWKEAWNVAIIGDLTDGSIVAADDGGDGWEIYLTSLASGKITTDRKIHFETADDGRGTEWGLDKLDLSIVMSKNASIWFDSFCDAGPDAAVESDYFIWLWVNISNGAGETEKIRYTWGGTEGTVGYLNYIELGSFAAEKTVERNLINDAKLEGLGDVVGWTIYGFYFYASDNRGDLITKIVTIDNIKLRV